MREEEHSLQGSRDIARRVGVAAHDDVSVEPWHTLRIIRMICSVHVATAVATAIMVWTRGAVCRQLRAFFHEPVEQQLLQNIAVANGFKFSYVKCDHCVSYAPKNMNAWKAAAPLRRTVPLLTRGDMDKEEHLVA